MDGRWKRWLACGFILSLVGCTHSNTVTSPSGSMPLASNKPRLEDKHEKKELSPDTLVAVADTRLAAAKQDNQSASQRESLLQSAGNLYQQAVQRDPKNLRGYCGLAEMYTFLGDKEKAIDMYRQAAKVFPKNSDIYVGMALCYKQFNDRSSALNVLHEATQKIPSDRRLKINLGFELAMANRHKEGYAWLERTLGPVKAHYSLAQVYEHQGNMAGTQNELQQALQEDPNYRPALDMVAQLSGTDHSNESDSGLKTVGYEDVSSIPDYRLAPNAKLISQPGSRNPPDQNPPPTTANSVPAASLQVPATVPGSAPRTLPAMPFESGWER